MDRGGAENAIMNYYRHIDRSKVQFDFLLTEQNHCAFEDEITDLGGRVYRVPRLTKTHPLRYIKAVDKFFKQHPEYQICHSHTATKSAIPLWIAKRNGVKNRICHSHTSSNLKGIDGILRIMLKKPLKKIATHWFSCGDKAAIFLYGENALTDSRVKIINNVIDGEKFNYNAEIRAKMRHRLGITKHDIVVGQVGRFVQIKNQRFTLEILCSLKNKIHSVKCLFIGDGEDQKSIAEYASALGVLDKCIFTGAVSDVYEYVQAMDIFVLPSFSEGLPLCIIEAQCAGLRSYVSMGVSQECKITELVDFLPLSEGADRWADKIANHYVYDRSGQLDAIRAAGYDATTTAKELQVFYQNLLNNNYENID